jgi:oxygen-dependent protoporphyrinogen oxidase
MELAHWELARLLDINGEPLLRQLTRQSHAMPQYHVGHCKRVASIERRLQQFPTLALAGSSLNGVGVPGCIESGEKAANRIAAALAAAPPASAQPLYT